MSHSREPTNLGVDLQRPDAGFCGLCGHWGKLTKAHVPARVAGNTPEVTSANIRIIDGVRAPGRQKAGGMWVRGLCGNCNSLAGARYDQPYADFADPLRRHTRVADRLTLLRPWEPPAVSVAPGLVARSVMFGMFAVSPHLRILFSELADDLREQRDHVAMPDGLSLRFALHPTRIARLTGARFAIRVITIREHYNTFADIYFKPLAWALVPTRGLGRAGNSVLDTQRWACADEWLRYGPDVTRVDLRVLAHEVPVVDHPLRAAQKEWVEMYARKIMPMLEGLIPA